jgi:histidine triad (HIT) family protein
MPDCIFCKIVRGEIPSFKVYENENVLGLLDIHPTNPGHTLVIPKQHAANIFEISKKDWLAVNEVVHLLAPKIENAVGADGMNIMMSNREHAGQTVFHAHVHLIPRSKGDGLKHWPQSVYKEGEAESVQEKIRTTLN